MYNSLLENIRKNSGAQTDVAYTGDRARKDCHSLFPYFSLFIILVTDPALMYLNEKVSLDS